MLLSRFDEKQWKEEQDIANAKREDNKKNKSQAKKAEKAREQELAQYEKDTKKFAALESSRSQAVRLARKDALWAVTWESAEEVMMGNYESRDMCSRTCPVLPSVLHKWQAVLPKSVVCFFLECRTCQVRQCSFCIKTKDFHAQHQHDTINCACNNNNDKGNLMLCCDACAEWQHGSCVGVKAAKTAPKPYLCELCKLD